MVSSWFKTLVLSVFLLWIGICIPFGVALAESNQKKSNVITTYYNQVKIKQILKQKQERKNIQKIVPKPLPKAWNGHFAATKFAPTTKDQRKLSEIKTHIDIVLKKLPSFHTAKLQSIEIRNTSHPSRGLASSKKIILNMGTIESYDEMKSIFTHEIGHIVDLGLLTGLNGHETGFHDHKKPVLSDDPSLQFYLISWNDNDHKVSNSTRKDFVSGYAMQNPFEDFSESYNFYIYHGDKFRGLAQNSAKLSQKYRFIQQHVFNGYEFDRGLIDNNYVNTAWDTTLLPLKEGRLVAQN